MKKLEELFEGKLEQYLNDYSDIGHDAGTQLKKTIDAAQTAEMIVPVLGMQGVGKSTLINALLRENILPNEADETTCVPVEVKHGETHYAKVHFQKDSHKEVNVHTLEELREYVDNNHNPANEKRVAYIELFRNIDWLRSGLTIVDLPGVGSLTRENEETTRKYVENLCSAIFVIPTVPTIRNSEALFIKSLWSQFSKAIFVQNDWGETQTEKDESLDFNNKVLNKIAKELHNPYNNEILVVNAYKGIDGVVNKDDALVASSNIDTLRDKIEDLTHNWDISKKELLIRRIISSIEYAICVLKKRVDDQNKSAEQVRIENEKNFNKFKECTIELERKADDIKRFLRMKEDDVYSVAREKSREFAARIRTEIFRVIDKGVYDGENLSKAFNRIQEEEIESISNEIMDVFVQIKLEVEEKFDALQALQIDNIQLFISQSFEKNEEIKWEKGVEIGGNIGGGIGGALGASKLLVALGVANPPVLVICGVGLAIYGVFSLIGRGIKKAKQYDRASQTKREIGEVIDNLEYTLKKEIPNKYDDFMAQCYKTLENMLKDRKKEEDELAKSYFSEQAKCDDVNYEVQIDYLQSKLKAFENEK